MTEPDKNTLQYRENNIASARPEDLTLMMYNGLMKFISRAQEEIRAKSLEAAHNTLIRCQDIVFEFQYTLNMDYSLSKNLMLLYDYLYNRLIEANAKKDCEILDEVYEFVSGLRDTWVEAIKINKEQKAEAAENAAAAAAATAAAASVAATSTATASTAAASTVVTAGTAGAGTVGAGTGIDATMAVTADAEAVTIAAAATTGTAALTDSSTVPAYAGAPDTGDDGGVAASSANIPTIGGASMSNSANAGAQPSTKAIYKRAGPPAMTSFINPGALSSSANSPTIITTPLDMSNEPTLFTGNTTKLFNPAAAAQYAKAAKAKVQPQEIISIASE